MHRSGSSAELPAITKQLLNSLKRDYCACYNKPDQRCKCSRAVFAARLRAMLLTCIRVRSATQRLLSNDIQYAIYGACETPLHINESGSTTICTRATDGARVVRLKENNADTSNRVTVMTTTTSCRAAACQQLHLQV